MQFAIGNILCVVIMSGLLAVQSVGCKKESGTPQPSSPSIDASTDTPNTDSADNVTTAKPLKERKEQGIIDRTIRTFEIRPGERFESPAGYSWRIMEIKKDRLVFGSAFIIAAQDDGRFPTGEYPMGNDHTMRILKVQHDPPLVTLELIYREGTLQDLAF